MYILNSTIAPGISQYKNILIIEGWYTTPWSNMYERLWSVKLVLKTTDYLKIVCLGIVAVFNFQERK